MIKRIKGAVAWRGRWLCEKGRAARTGIRLGWARFLLFCAGRFPALGKKLWAKHQQSRELAHHIKSGKGFRSSEAFAKQSADFFNALGLPPEMFAGKAVVDIGAGSRLRTAYFNQSDLYAIEPLADQFRNLPQCDFHLAKGVYGIPAEERVESLVGRTDLVVCLNVLDHVFNPKAVLANAWHYLRPGGCFVLQTDYHVGQADLQHPAEFSKEWLFDQFAALGFVVEADRPELNLTGAEHAVTLLLRRPAS